MSIKINHLLFFIFLFSGVFFGFSQNYQVLYKVNFRPKKEKNDLKTEYMRLETLPKSKSIFYNYKKDSINSQKEDQTYLRFTVIQEDKKYNYYGNFNDLYFTFNEPLKADWKISNKTSDFNDYKVQEAKIEADGRKWVALFAPEIPIINGPYKFSGLPSLILKIYSEDGDYSFEMIEITKYTSESFILSFQTSKFVGLKKKKVEAFISNFLKDPGSQNFKLVNSYGDSYDYSFSGKKDKSYKDMNDSINGYLERYNNPIDKKIYLLIF
ncbi:GLPGLI family protein [Chryseobacterium tongliaoense]|uniref:GLPGLI family protein n=1 Tax=Chryseobacterium tongliaoense TaxID=3240933 RepID=UPI0035164391